MYWNSLNSKSLKKTSIDCYSHPSLFQPSLLMINSIKITSMPLLVESLYPHSMNLNRKCSLYWTTTVLSILKFSTVIYWDFSNSFNKKSSKKKVAKRPEHLSIEKIQKALKLRDKTIEEKCYGKRGKDQERKYITIFRILRKVVRLKNANDLTDIVYIFFNLVQIWIFLDWKLEWNF